MVIEVVSGLILCLIGAIVCHLYKGILINTPSLLLLLQHLTAPTIVLLIRKTVVRQCLKRARLFLLLLRQLYPTCIVFGHQTLRLDFLRCLLRLGRLVELLAGMGPALLHAQLG